ncbi:MAG: trehalase family glycosidase, partial [Candidatus Hydrogenedentes bacterium]|nr:trehalase family glycosidase [Candidatus Hydrogenedentota bacterium]
FSDFALDAPPADELAVFVVEGETVQRPGGAPPDKKAAASGGEVLGSNFGGQAGDHAVWSVDVTSRIENAAVSIRYAREMTGDADVAVRAPGRKRMERRPFPSTGGWGDSPGDFRMQTFRFGPIDPGLAGIEMYVMGANGNINIDAVYVHDVNVQPVAGERRARAVRAIALEPGAKKTVTLCMSASPKIEKTVAALARATSSKDALQAQIDAYAAWNLANVPSFASVDPAITKQYWHRASSVLRKNLFRIGEGNLKDWGIAEGRWGSSWYSNMISYGAGHQIREARWLRDPRYVRGIISTWCANAKPNGVFPNYIRPTEIGDGQYTDWITSTVWDAHCVHPDTAALRTWSAALSRNVDGWLITYDADNDGLLLVDSHWWTGMEWQPSFFFFNGYDKDKQDQHLERVDLTSYVYGNAMNLSRALSVIGDEQGAAKYGAIAEKIRGALEKSMWDETTQFFYSLEPTSGEKAMVKEVIGVYPFYFSMFDKGSSQKYLNAWTSILDPREFWTPWPVASATQLSPAYSQDENFNGKRVGGCMWNGPTWPHANSIVLSAMAATLRDHSDSPLTVEHLFALFQSYTMAQFSQQALEFPITGEYYNGETGRWRTDERDYNHSTYIDVLIADIAGLRPRADEVIEVQPLISKQMAPFVLDGIRYHDHDISILWSPTASMETQPDALKGFRVYVDGKLRHHDPEKATAALIQPE